MRQAEGERLYWAAAMAAVVLILPMAATLSFHGDEWSYIVDRRLTIESLLQPHNEHLAALHVLAYRLLVELVGTDSYVPFLSLLLVCHVALARGVLALLRQRATNLAALAAAVLLLFLGSGFDNLVWAFQSGFVGSLALGTWALVLAQRPWWSALLLTAAVATHSPGLFFVAPLAILIRRRVPLILPIGLYVVWLSLVGRESIPFPGAGPYIAYAATMLGSVAGGLSGVGLPAGFAVAAAYPVALATQAWRDRGLDRFVIAGLAGLASGVVILAFGRAHFGPEQATASRYIYASAPFVLMTLTAFRSVPPSIWSVLFAISFVANVATLPHGVALYQAFLRYDRSIPLEQRLAPFRDSPPEASPHSTAARPPGGAGPGRLAADRTIPSATNSQSVGSVTRLEPGRAHPRHG